MVSDLGDTIEDQGKVLVDADSVVDMMRRRDVRKLTCTLAAGMSIAGTSYSGVYNLAEFTLVDGNQVRVQFIIERSEIHTYVASGNTPRNWAKSAVVQGGIPTLSRGSLDSMLQIAPNNWGSCGLSRNLLGITYLLISNRRTHT